MKTTLVIMAAGIGSRFGGGIKQLAPVGLNGEIIMDYSIHDAIEAGFNKIVFIIRKDIEDAFKEAIGDRIEEICKNFKCRDCLCISGIKCTSGGSRTSGRPYQTLGNRSGSACLQGCTP